MRIKGLGFGGLGLWGLGFQGLGDCEGLYGLKVSKLKVTGAAEDSRFRGRAPGGCGSFGFKNYSRVLSSGSWVEVDGLGFRVGS